MVGYSRAAAPVASIGTSFYFARSAKKDTVEPALTVVLSTEVLPRGWAGPRRAARDRTLKPTSTRSGAPDPLSASRREREERGGASAAGKRDRRALSGAPSRARANFSSRDSRARSSFSAGVCLFPSALWWTPVFLLAAVHARAPARRARAANEADGGGGGESRWRDQPAATMRRRRVSAPCINTSINTTAAASTGSSMDHQ